MKTQDYNFGLTRARYNHRTGFHFADAAVTRAGRENGHAVEFEIPGAQTGGGRVLRPLSRLWQIGRLSCFRV